MGEPRYLKNLNKATINPNKILDIHKKQIRILKQMVMEDACNINGQFNLWKALQDPSSKTYLKRYVEKYPLSDYNEVIKLFVAQGKTNNYIVAINLLIKILQTSTILVGQNGIESILHNSQNRASQRNLNDCNQTIRLRLDQIEKYFRNPTQELSREDCFTPTLWILISAENDFRRIQKGLVMEEARVASQKIELRKVEKLRNLSGAVGISILAVSYLAKFKYAEFSFIAGLIPTVCAMLQHGKYLKIKRQLTKAKA